MHGKQKSTKSQRDGLVINSERLSKIQYSVTKSLGAQGLCYWFCIKHPLRCSLCRCRAWLLNALHFESIFLPNPIQPIVPLCEYF